MPSHPDDDPVSLTRDGKRILRERYQHLKETEALSLEKLGIMVGCSHGMVRLLIHDETTIGLAMEPSWSSPFVPALCRKLGVSLWEVIAGLSDAHRKALAAVDRVKDLAPEALDEFLEGIEDLAEGKVARHASRASARDDAPKEPPPGPTLRTVR